MRSLRQVRYTVTRRGDAEDNMRMLLDSMELPVGRIERLLGEPLEGKRILEIGPGQGLERARYFGINNDVVAMDRDVIPTGFNLGTYWEMARTNGLGRVLKTGGRHLLVGRPMQKAFEKLTGQSASKLPTLSYGDIETEPLDPESFDVVMNWSVFEHIGDPKRALENLIAALKPGGVLHISIHIYTAHDGHHDIRAFTGDGDALPIWGHLRPSTQDQIEPSSYLNEWRIDDWRKLFAEVAPGADEYLDEYEVRERFTPQLTTEIREELADYSDEELFTVNAVYTWRKEPAA